MVHQRLWWFILVEESNHYIFGLDVSSDPCFVCGELLFGLRKTRAFYNLDKFGWFEPAADQIWSTKIMRILIYWEKSIKQHHTIFKTNKRPKTPRCFGLPAARANSLKSRLAASWVFLPCFPSHWFLLRFTGDATFGEVMVDADLQSKSGELVPCSLAICRTLARSNSNMWWMWPMGPWMQQNVYRTVRNTKRQERF